MVSSSDLSNSLNNQVPPHTAHVSHSTLSNCKFMFYPHPTRGRSCFLFLKQEPDLCQQGVNIHNYLLQRGSLLPQSNPGSGKTLHNISPHCWQQYQGLKKADPFPRTALGTSTPINVSCQLSWWSCSDFRVEICLINELKSSLLCLISHTGVQDLAESKFSLGITCKDVETGAVAHRYFHGLGGFLLTPPTPGGVKPLSGVNTQTPPINCIALIAGETKITQGSRFYSSALELDPATTKLSSIPRTPPSQMNFLVRKWFHH